MAHEGCTATLAVLAVAARPKMARPNWLLASVVIVVCGCTNGAAADEPLLDHLVAVWSIPSEADFSKNPLSSEAPVEVLRFELDVTHDGVPELFLGTTWATGRQGVAWLVHSRQSDGRFRPLGVATFGYEKFLYKPEDSMIFALRSPGGGQWGCTYYHVGEDGVSELLGALEVKPLQDEAAMQAWQQEGRPRMQVAKLSDLRESASPRWRDSVTGAIVPSLGRLDDLVTESGACSAEKFLDDFRDAGCVP